MTFYLIGLGLNENSITKESIGILNKCKKIYLENYTVDFPYKIEELEKSIGRKVISLDRERVEKEEFVVDAKKIDVALLVYGSPLSATTHYSALMRCRKEGIKYRIIYNGSIFDAIAETGLQIYKFGKTASMPKWIKGKYEPMSFIELVRDNIKIKSHTIILVDIGLEFEDAIWQLIETIKRNKIDSDKIIVCSSLGTENSRIYYGKFNKLLDLDVRKPFCFVIPSDELHFTEEEVLEEFKV